MGVIDGIYYWINTCPCRKCDLFGSAPPPSDDSIIVSGPRELRDGEGQFAGFQLPFDHPTLDAARSTISDSPPGPRAEGWVRTRDAKNEIIDLGISDWLPELSAAIEETFLDAAPSTAIDTYKSIETQWSIGDTNFTNATINRDYILGYHVDVDFVEDLWTIMLSLRKDTDGMMLHLLEPNIYIPCEDATLFAFKGQSVHHSVSPAIDPGGRPDNSYRATIVWYSKLDLVENKLAVIDDEKLLNDVKG